MVYIINLVKKSKLMLRLQGLNVVDNFLYLPLPTDLSALYRRDIWRRLDFSVFFSTIVQIELMLYCVIEI